MFIITCRELTGADCDFAVEAETAIEARDLFYEHGAESPLHRDRFMFASPQEKAAFARTVDEYLAKQAEWAAPVR